MDCGKSTLALQMDHNNSARGRQGLIFTKLDRMGCLLYTSDAADERSSVDLGGRRIIKKKKPTHRRVSSLTH